MDLIFYINKQNFSNNYCTVEIIFKVRFYLIYRQIALKIGPLPDPNSTICPPLPPTHTTYSSFFCEQM